MKKTYLLIITALLSGFAAFSQVPAPCVVDETNNEIGLTPDNLGEFCQDIEVNQVIQAALPNDTNLFGLTVSFNTIQFIVDESTIPAGLSFDCADNCLVTAGPAGELSRSCLTMYGTPTNPSENGSDVIMVTALVSHDFGEDYEYPLPIELTIVPTGESPCIIDGLEDFEIGSALSVYPNPSKGNAYINLEMPATSNVNIELFDVIGNKIESVYSGILSEGTNNIAINKANELTSGMYMLKVDVDSSKGTNTYTERLIVR